MRLPAFVLPEELRVAVGLWLHCPLLLLWLLLLPWLLLWLLLLWLRMPGVLHRLLLACLWRLLLLALLLLLLWLPLPPCLLAIARGLTPAAAAAASTLPVVNLLAVRPATTRADVVSGCSKNATNSHDHEHSRTKWIDTGTGWICDVDRGKAAQSGTLVIITCFELVSKPHTTQANS
jgi:hypothetical protein